MNITKKSIYSGKEHTMDLPVTNEQIRKWQSGVLIQDAMPHLNTDQREFLISGCTPEEWNEMFPPEEE